MIKRKRLGSFHLFLERVRQLKVVVFEYSPQSIQKALQGSPAERSRVRWQEPAEFSPTTNKSYCSLNKILFGVWQTFPQSEPQLRVTAVSIALIVCT
jgi:hypothetical protein